MSAPLTGRYAASAPPIWPEWEGAARLTARAGEDVYAQGEPADLVYLLTRGVVRTSHLLADGRRLIGDFYYPGDMVGVEADETHRFSAEALSDCEFLALRRGGSSAYPAGRLDRLLLRATARELERAQAHMMLLGKTTACEKVARFLQDIARRSRADVVPLPMSRQDIADYLGLTIETVSRMLGRLQADSIVQLIGARRFQIRRPQALAELASGG